MKSPSKNSTCHYTAFLSLAAQGNVPVSNTAAFPRPKNNTLCPTHRIDLPRPNRDGVSAHKLLRMPIKQGFLRQTAARLMSHWHHLHVLYIKPVYIAWLGFNRPCNGKGPLKEFLTENKPCPHSPAAALNLSSCAGFPCLPLIHHFLSLLSCACPFGIQHYSPSQPPFYHSRSPAFGGTPLHQLCRGGKGEKHLRTEM